jgi:hypothetical protein
MCSFLYHCQYLYRNGLYIWIIRWVSYRKQELLNLREHLSSPRHYVGVCVAIIFSLCDVLLCFFMLWFLWCEVRYDYCINPNFVLPPAVCRRVHVLFTLCVFVCLFWCQQHNILPLPCTDYKYNIYLHVLFSYVHDFELISQFFSISIIAYFLLHFSLSCDKKVTTFKNITSRNNIDCMSVMHSQSEFNQNLVKACFIYQ